MKTVLSESAGLTHEASLEFLVPKIQPVPLLRLLFNEPWWFLLQRLQVCSPLILSLGWITMKHTRINWVLAMLSRLPLEC